MPDMDWQSWRVWRLKRFASISVGWRPRSSSTDCSSCWVDCRYCGLTEEAVRRTRRTCAEFVDFCCC